MRLVSSFCCRLLVPVFLLGLIQFPLIAQEDSATDELLPEMAGALSEDELLPETVGALSEDEPPLETGVSVEDVFEEGISSEDVSEEDIFTEDVFGENVSETPEIKAVPKGFFSFFSLSLGASILLFPESDAHRSDPTPILSSPRLALGFPFAFPGSTAFSLEMSLDVYLAHYTYSSVLQKPVPAAIENRSSLVIGPVVGLQIQGKTGIGPLVFLRYFLGAAFDLRIVLIAQNLNDSDTARASDNTELTRDYFWDEERWIFSTVGVGLDFKTAPTLSFGIDGRVWAPFNQLLSREKRPGLDGWRLGIGFHVTFMSETRDKIISRDIDRIKKKYAVEENDYAFILYHLSKNPPLHGIEPARLADEIAKTYKHSGLYTEERAGISSGKIIDMFTDVIAIDKDYDYDSIGNVINKK